MMDFKTLLKGKTDCPCGKAHTCPIDHVYIGSGATEVLPELTEGYQSIVLVADENTYEVQGSAVERLLAGKIQSELIYPGATVLVPDENAIDALQECVTDKTDLIIGIGSGVIQDLCKCVSFQEKLPYHIVATAPSMDGYASVGAAMILGGMKVTLTTHVPEAIVADADILKDAPMDLIQSGYGDILGKYSCLNDWKLARAVRGEYFCQYVYDLTYDILIKTKDLGPRLLERDPEAIRILMEALVGVGVAMAFVGNSRPASGSEHHLSHFFEITGIVDDTPYFMHGTDVVYSSVYTEKLREALLKLDAPAPNTIPAREVWEENIRRVYTSVADGVIALQDKLGWYREDRCVVYAEKWQEIKAILAEAPASDEMVAYLSSVGLDIADFEKLYGQQKIADALKYAKDLKDRYSVLWMYYDLMVH